MAVDHHEDYAEMPPNQPKLPAAQLQLIHSWIAGGLVLAKGGKTQLREMAFSVAAGTPAKMVKIFSTEDGRLLHRIEKHTDWVDVVRFSPEGKLLASADRNGGVHVGETDSGGIVYTLDEHKVKVTAMSWRGDGKVLASAAEDRKFVLWDMSDGWAMRTTSPHVAKSQSRYTRRTGVLDIAFASDGRILTTGRDQSIKLWRTDGVALGKSEALTALRLSETSKG